jgi:PHD/YefM family antitoxin component YafN of YafNO toxin-antitoxin module
MIDAPEKVLRISHLREVLGYACKQVALTGEPIVVQRYNRQEVILVPLADWRYYQQMEAEIRDAGAADDPLENLPEFLPD